MDDLVQLGLSLVCIYAGMLSIHWRRRKRQSSNEATSVAKDTSFLKYLNDFGVGFLIGIAIFTVIFGEPTSLVTFEPTTWLRLLSEFIIFSVVLGSVSFQLDRWMNRKT